MNTLTDVRPGCRGAWMPLGNASVFVEYELIDGQAQVLSMFINGMWVDPQDVLADHMFDRWQSELSRSLEDEAEQYSRPRLSNDIEAVHADFFRRIAA